MKNPIALLAAVLLSACAALPPPPPPAADVQQCCVCRYRRDFSCLEVRATPATPHVTVNGRTRYFCSESCKRDYLAGPSQFSAGR